jgi:hypothetical protein
MGTTSVSGDAEAISEATWSIRLSTGPVYINSKRAIATSDCWVSAMLGRHLSQRDWPR